MRFYGGWRVTTTDRLVRIGVYTVISRRLRACMVWCCVATAVATLPTKTLAGKSRAPNVVLVLADDLGWSDVGFQGGRRHETPHLSTLANDGMVFSNFHVSPNCSPSRAALLSGLYSPRTGVYTVDKAGRFDTSMCPLEPVPNVTRLPLETTTIAQSMKKLGYATAMFGKWHLGDDGDYHPSKRGFDEAIVTSIDKHFDFSTDPETLHPEGQYLADFVTDRAVDFIERHKSVPFFLYLPHLAVHRPLQADDAAVREFLEKNPKASQAEATYAAMVSSLDSSVGRIRNALREFGIDKETVFIFCSDNGGVGGYRREGLDAEDVTDNAPLRSGKGSLYEGGTRVPFVIAWPENIPPGSRCDVPAIHVDLFPTLCELAGGEGEGKPMHDGQSLVPWILNQPDKPVRRALFQHFPGYLGIEGKPGQWRTTPVSTITHGKWKLLEFLDDGRSELYDLEADPGEKNNLCGSRPDIVRELHGRLAEWRKEVAAPMPERRKDPS